MTKNQNSLPVGTQLDQYRIERVLGVGGFSIVYLATKLTTDNQVVIKEYMPQKMAQRDEDQMVTPKSENDAALFNQGRTLFLHEARALATLKHPNIVDVFNFFSAHDTVYMVMNYLQGVNLQAYIREHQGGMSERFLCTIFPKLLQGLKHLHSQGLLHLDIKPSNIHIRPGGEPILLDFGAIHQQQLSRQHQPGKVISPGYSPYEQCQSGGYVGPWSDLYAIGATMRACIEGCAPIPARERMEGTDKLKPAVQAFKKRYKRTLLEAIDWAMEPDPLLRPQSVDEFMAALSAPAEDQQGEPEPSGQEAMVDWITGNMAKIRTALSNLTKDEK